MSFRDISSDKRYTPQKGTDDRGLEQDARETIRLQTEHSKRPCLKCERGVDFKKWMDNNGLCSLCRD